MGMFPEYRKSITDWPVPATKKELASYLGRAGYYRSFIPQYSDLTSDLNKAKTREQTPWSLTTEEIAQFHKLQLAFNTSESLSFPNYDDLKLNPLIMNLDYSKKGLSASISQNQECQDSIYREKLFCNVSHKAPSELAVSSIHRGEILACVLGLSSFRHLLLLASFKIRSDSISVRYLSTLKDQRAPMPRYFQLLADFTFTAEHTPGKLNIPDDTISRRDDLPEITRDEKDFHPSRSFVDQMTSISQLEALEDIAMEFADPLPALWAPQAHQTNAVWPCSPQDIVTTDIATPNIQQNSICLELHPKLQYLNEIQLKYRGKVGDTDKHLTEILPPVPPIVASVSSAGAPVCPAVIQAAPAGAPGSSAVLPTAPLARDPPRSTEIHRDPLKSIGPQTPRMGQAPLYPTTTRLSRQQAQAGPRHPGILAPWQPGTLAPGHPGALGPRLPRYGTSLHSGLQAKPSQAGPRPPAATPRLPQDGPSIHYRPQVRPGQARLVSR